MKRRLFVALCLLAVMALAGTFIIRTNSSTSPTDEVTAVDSQATPPTAQSTPSTTIDPQAATKGGEVEKAVHQQIKKEGTASVVISLDVPVTSSVTETAQRTTRAIDEFLAQLPPGSYSNVDAAGVLPVLTLTLNKNGVDALTKIGIVGAATLERTLRPTQTVETETTPTSETSPAATTQNVTTQNITAPVIAAAASDGFRGAVAVIDSGIDINHPYLQRSGVSKNIAEACFADDCFPGSPSASVDMTYNSAPRAGSASSCGDGTCTHGTHVAGIAVGGTDESSPRGAAPDANLISVRVMSKSTGSAQESWLINSLQWLYWQSQNTNNLPNLRAINLSLGTDTVYSSTSQCDYTGLAQIIRNLRSVGIYTVIASGNEYSRNGVSYPGCVSDAITVGSTNASGTMSSFSNYASFIDFYAVGESVCSAKSGIGVGCGTYGGAGLIYESGTSMAAPYVAGMLARLGRLSAAQALDRLTQTGIAVAGYNGLRVTESAVAPFGSFELASGGYGTLQVAGWAIDPDTNDPISITAVGQVATTTAVANRSRPDIETRYPLFGPAHGFEITMAAPTTSSTVCLTALGISIGGNSSLGCRVIAALPSSPIGFIDSATAGLGTISVAGWTLDPESTSSISVQVTASGRSVTVVGDGFRPDIGAAFPTFGSNHGYSAQLTGMPGGTHQVCVTALNVGFGSNTSLGCRNVTVPGGSPFGSIDVVSTGPGSITVSGWAIDPDTANPISMRAESAGRLISTTANGSRPDVGMFFPLYGSNHGYSMTFSNLPTGNQYLCVAAANVGLGGDTLLGCRIVFVPDGSPIGFFDWASGGPGTVTVGGWALDPETPSPILMQVAVAGRLVAGVANQNRPDVGAVFPALGPSHGYTISLDNIPPGPQTVCVAAVDAGGGYNVFLGCRNVNVTSDLPFGFVDSIQRSGGNVTVRGWVIDPNTQSPVTLHVYGRTILGGATASIYRADLASFFGSGNHGFEATFALPDPSTPVCVYALNLGSGGANPLLGCG